MRTFLLIHGAFRGGWAWSRVRGLLVAEGHDVHAPSLLGCGERVGLLDRVTGLDSWVDELVGLVVAEDLSDIVVCGHSQGGVVAAALAARVPERIAALAFLDGAVPQAGERAVDLGPGTHALPPRDAVVPARAPVAGDDLDEATAAWIAERLTPTPFAPSLDPLPGIPEGVAQHHAFCERTPAGFPSQVTRARLDAAGADYLVLDCSHDAPLVAPGAVAEWLSGIAARGAVAPRARAQVAR